MNILAKVEDYQRDKVNQIMITSRTAQKNGIVFLGDSMVNKFDLKSYFNIDNLYNCGVNGATSDLLLHLFPHAVEAYAPSKLVIMVGTNDLSDKWQFDKLESAFNIYKFLQIMMRKLPKTEVVVISALPIVDELQRATCRDTNQIRLLMKEYKANVLECDNAIFVDVFDEFLEDGQMKKEYTTDGLHLTKEGYNHLFSLIKGYI